MMDFIEVYDLPPLARFVAPAVGFCHHCRFFGAYGNCHRRMIAHGKKQGIPPERARAVRQVWA
jgi:hypothetical protein